MAISDKHHECVAEPLAEGAEVRMPDDCGRTPLFYCMDGEMVELLLNADVSGINDTDDRGWTALYRASRCGRNEVMVALLSRGADPTQVDKAGRSARDYWENDGRI